MYAFNTQWDWLKHNNVMILQYLFTFKSGSYYWTGQFNLTISHFFVRNKNGSAHNSWQDRWRSSWHCSESKTYRGTQCIYWKPFSSDLCLKHKIIVKNDLLSLMVIQKSTLYVQILNCLPSSNAQLDGRLS